MILLVGARPWFLALSTAFVLVLATFVLQPHADFEARSFFGVTQVLESPDGRPQAADEWHDGPRLAVDRPGERRTPQSYYVRSGPIGDLFRLTTARATDGGPTRSASPGWAAARLPPTWSRACR